MILVTLKNHNAYYHVLYNDKVITKGFIRERPQAFCFQES